MGRGLRHDKEEMRLAFASSMTLWGIIALLAAASFVGILYWIARRLGAKEEAKRPVPRAIKKHRPVLRKQKKRVLRNAVKRRRARKAGMIVLRSDDGPDLVNPGGEQVGFFG